MIDCHPGPCELGYILKNNSYCIHPLLCKNTQPVDHLPDLSTVWASQYPGQRRYKAPAGYRAQDTGNDHQTDNLSDQRFPEQLQTAHAQSQNSVIYTLSTMLFITMVPSSHDPYDRRPT